MNNEPKISLQEFVKTLEPYLGEDKVIRDGVVLREIVRNMPDDLFATARYDYGIVRNSGKLDGNFNAFSGSGFLMRWYIVVGLEKDFLKGGEENNVLE